MSNIHGFNGTGSGTATMIPLSQRPDSDGYRLGGPQAPCTIQSPMSPENNASSPSEDARVGLHIDVQRTTVGDVDGDVGSNIVIDGKGSAILRVHDSSYGKVGGSWFSGERVVDKFTPSPTTAYVSALLAILVFLVYLT